MPKSASMYVCAIMKKETTIAQPGIVLKLKIQKLMLERQLVNEFLRSKSYLSMCKDTLYYQFFVICGINVSDGLKGFISRSSFVYEILHYNKVNHQVLMMKKYQYIRNKTVECCVNIK